MKWEVSTHRAPKAQFGYTGLRRNHRTHGGKMLMIGGALVTMMMFFMAIILHGQFTDNQAIAVKAPEAKVDDLIAYGSIALVAPAGLVAEGTKLDSVEVREVFWPRDKVPEGAVRDFEEVREMFARVPLAAGQPVLRANLTSTPPSIGIEKYLREGYRAVTIEVDARTGVEGWARPGAHVDLLLTYTDTEDGQKKTRVAVEDAIVVSYNGSTERATAESDQASRRTARVVGNATVTLMVPFDDTLKIETARAVGRITLALRHSGDSKSTGDKFFSASDFDSNKEQKSSHQAKGETQSLKGQVSYTDNQGEKRTLNLSNDNRWWQQDDLDR